MTDHGILAVLPYLLIDVLGYIGRRFATITCFNLCASSAPPFMNQTLVNERAVN